MTVTAKCLVECKVLENSLTTQLPPSSGIRTTIDKVTTTNYSGVSATVSMYKVPAAGAAGTSNLIKTKTLLAGETYTWPELVGHTLNSSDFIATNCTVATSVNFTMSGREQT